MEILNFNSHNNSSSRRPAVTSITLPSGFNSKSDVRVTRLRIPKSCFPQMFVETGWDNMPAWDAATQAYWVTKGLTPTALSIVLWDAFVRTPDIAILPPNQVFLTGNPSNNTALQITRTKDDTFEYTDTYNFIHAPPTPDGIMDGVLPILEGSPVNTSGITVGLLCVREPPRFDPTGHLVRSRVPIYDINDFITNGFVVLSNGYPHWDLHLACIKNQLELTVTQQCEPSVYTSVVINPMPTLMISKPFLDLLKTGSFPAPTESAWKNGYTFFDTGFPLKNAIWQHVILAASHNGIDTSLVPFALIRKAPDEQSDACSMIQNMTLPDTKTYKVESGDNLTLSVGSIWNKYRLNLDISRIMPVTTLIISTPDIPIHGQKIVVNNTISTGSIDPSFLPVIRSVLVSVFDDEMSDLLISDDSLTTAPVHCEKANLYTMTVKLDFLLKDNSLFACSIAPDETFNVQLSFSP